MIYCLACDSQTNDLEDVDIHSQGMMHRGDGMKNTVALLGAAGSAFLLVLLLAHIGDSQAALPRAAPLDVIINEVAWGGTAASSADEWIELYNNTPAAVDLSGWTLTDNDDVTVTLSGAIPAGGYFLLERSDDCTISDISADQIYIHGLDNDGERLELWDDVGGFIDSADGSSGWPGGSGAPGYYSMERVDPTAPDTAGNWAGNDGVTRNGLDCNGNPLNGTPQARNSAFVPPGADLCVDKRGPASVLAGDPITYTIILSNAGQLPALAVRLTDVLPLQITFVTHTAPYPWHQPTTGTLVWELGAIPAVATGALTLTITGLVDEEAWGELTNAVTVTSATTEGHPADNYDAALTVIGRRPVTPVLLIEALHYDGYEGQDADEAVRVVNVSSVTASLGGWGVSDGGNSTATFPPGTALAPGQALWCARQAVAFARQFGFLPDFETGDTDPAVPEMDGSWPGYANDGDECLLFDAAGELVDVLVYKGGETATGGWSGEAVEPWTSGSTFAAEGQILYRKRNQATGLPMPDTGTASDWAQDPGDPLAGRKVLYPGWDLDAFFFTRRVTETALLTVTVAPDNAFDTVAAMLAGARKSIQIEAYSFHSRELAGVLLDRLDAGVNVTLLLEGAPAFTGIADQEKWVARQLYDAGAEILFMVNDDEADVHDRYDNQHAKFVIVDGRIALVGSENMNSNGLPADDKANGTAGRRGVLLATNAPGVVARIQAVFAADTDSAHHLDVVGCEHPFDCCTPPPGFQPELTPDWTTYTVQFPAPLITQGTFAFEVIHSPENSLRTKDGLLGLLGRAGPGDTILVEEFYEYIQWGTGGDPEIDPNPRLAAYLDAARQGAKVRILLDGFFDQDGDNAATVAYLWDVARAEGLDLKARLGNPTALGLHNKMVLAHIGGQGYVHVGSINGSEASFKANREMALQVQSDKAYVYLQAVFDYDWRTATPRVHLPLVVKSYHPPQPADHLLVSEVYYNTIPEKEWVEIYNPTSQTVDLSTYKIGDAVYPDDYEGMYRFPPGTILAPYHSMVVAVTTSGFQAEFPGRLPDFELLDTDPGVPDLLDWADWGTGSWALNNASDEVLLLDGSNQAVDVIVYGDAVYPGVTPHPGGVDHGHSLERVPPWRDTDDCSIDFRDWPYPSPGEQPQ